MKRPFFEWVLIMTLITGTSGCGVLPQLGAKREASGQLRPLSAVSEPARATAEKYFGSAAGLSAAREVEGSKTYYEVQGQKKARTVALKLTEAGRIVEKEMQ